MIQQDRYRIDMDDLTYDMEVVSRLDERWWRRTPWQAQAWVRVRSKTNSLLVNSWFRSGGQQRGMTRAAAKAEADS